MLVTYTRHYYFKVLLKGYLGITKDFHISRIMTDIVDIIERAAKDTA